MQRKACGPWHWCGRNTDAMQNVFVKHSHYKVMVYSHWDNPGRLFSKLRPALSIQIMHHMRGSAVTLNISMAVIRSYGTSPLAECRR